ncbi:DNA mismatch repair protein MSH6-like [Pyrus x bretschneideri]|uniref:DNA mismatch repair protein MSH6-like n=1 Tax=Pyrus x bretschneideri TaxID=225117 RepID=UPI00202EFEE3|nr:DNA mismatch repair protein MSH6-like [Pyrus x bretschneideri]
MGWIPFYLVMPQQGLACVKLRSCSSGSKFLVLNPTLVVWLEASYNSILTAFVTRQWWEFKSKHMDKVLFFKMGKFYELFEMDAHIAAKELGLQSMKGEQPHCGFPEKNFSMNVEKLVRKGYRVLVVEQTETPEQMDLRRKEDGSRDKVCSSFTCCEICAVVTKRTLTEGEMVSANPDASYLMAVTENSQNLANQTAERLFGVCVVDVATSWVILGQEVRSIYRRANDQLVYGSPKNASLHASDSHLEEDGYGCLPEVLSEMICNIWVPSSGFGDTVSKPYMILDSAALENLEIFENNRNGDSSGLLRTWLARPLYHAELIKQRHNAVSSLRGVNLPYALEFRKAISRLLDIERLLVHVCSSKGLPDVNSVLKHFKDAFDWVEANNSGRIIPHEGVDIEYDSACEKVKEIESHLAKHLQEQRKLLGDKSITYVTVEKDSYLLEMPESLCSSIPSAYELRSSKKGFSKYWTPDIKKSLTELSLAETDKESSLKSILPRKGSFVSNDIAIGGSGHASFILLTDPNMGGKSTLIHQVCLAVILAQLGADVPAGSFELSPVNRIFVRMGAKDNIMSSATRNSLVALDELGRGTSTSDGQAIVESVLEHFIYKVQCRGTFSTHYHRLAVDYQNNSKVSLCHMACQVGNGDGGVEEVTFLYRMSPGACPKSYGVNISRLAGRDLCLVLLPY